jgi:hypothetical protein
MEGLWPIDLTPEQQKIADKVKDLNAQRVKLVNTFTTASEQPEKAKEIEKLQNQISAAGKEFGVLQKAREDEAFKKLTPEEQKDIITGKTARTKGMQYVQSVAAAGGQEFEQSSFSMLKGIPSRG